MMIASRLAVVAALSLVFSVSTAASPPGQTILVWSFGFAPNPIRLAAGQPITLTFQNRSGSSHDFTARQFFASSRITAGAAPEGEIELKPYETKSVTLIPRAGTYKAHCSHFFHEPLGMSDTIVVS
jgi:plastocyanin